MMEGSEETVEKDIKKELKRIYTELALNQIEMDEEAKIILHNNLWELYD